MNTREDWLTERRRGIGGSDAAAVLGLSKWKSPLQVWMEKRGELIDHPDSEPMLWGRALEPVIRQQYAERTGRVVRLPENILWHPSHAFMLATVDGVTDDGRLLEIKTARTADSWGEPGTDEIPQAYLIQVQHYLAVTALPVADVAVLIGGSDFRLYEVESDPELQDLIIEGETSFWTMVESGTPPEPMTFADLRTRFGRISAAGTVEADDACVQAINRLKDIKAQIKALEAEEEERKAIVMKVLGDRDTLALNGITLATWKSAKAPVRFDTKAFMTAHPDLYGQYLKDGEPSRRFLIK